MISAPFRLPEGGLIDRATRLRFRFDGRSYEGHAGDTLASALIANGVRLVGRSFKYHRPRGILTAGSEEPNALVEVGTRARRTPNTRATEIALYDGLEAESQNRWPSLRHDAMAVASRFGRLIPAGFYYKTFMWPAAFWEKVYEPAIRRAAGLGRAANAPDPDTYEKAFAFCDVLVVGSGPAGLAAALAACRAGARVILAEEEVCLGGRLNAERCAIDDAPALAWAAKAEAELAASRRVRIMRRSTVVTVFDHGTYSVVERVVEAGAVPQQHVPRERHWRVVAKQCVLAAGAHERPIVFGDNDRPGVMLAGAMRTYLNRFAVAPGRNLVLFTASDDGWRTALDWHAAGLHVAAVVTPGAIPNTSAIAAMRAHGTLILENATVTRALGAHGVHAVEVVTARGSNRIACDALAVAGGWSPAIHLTCHLGGRPRWDAALAAFVPSDIPPDMRVAGAAAGIYSLRGCLESGHDAGLAAARACGHGAAVGAVPASDDEPAGATPCWHVGASGGKAFVDFQNDVTEADIRLAAREGYRSVEHLKRYTTLGMATDQGKTANVNGLAILAEALGEGIADVGTTTFRPPYTPVSIGTLAGHHRGKDYRPTRLTPTHRWAEAQGAVFVEAGAWLRAQWFPLPGERDWLESVDREVRATRTSVGVCDVSTLGKIDIQGPDAAAFLERVYVNRWQGLAVGRVRYGVMLREDGFVLDDGTTARLGADHFLMTTTTANAARVLQHLEFCAQVLFPDLDLALTPVTEQWAQLSVAGPCARDVLGRIVDGAHDISDAALPHMSVRDVTVRGGRRARLFRISFSGELGYELAVPAGEGEATMAALMAAGAEFGITPYGTEALGVMRIEKGHVAGNEINGTTTAADLGLGRMMSPAKDCIGRQLAGRLALTDQGRWRLVGLKPVDHKERLRAGAHFVARMITPTLESSEGYVTSVCHSPTLGHWIGLGLLDRGDRRHGERLRAFDPVRRGDVEVEICDPVFYDREGGRLHG